MSPIGIKHQAIATIGVCIYCRQPAVGDEHAIPRGLNGVYTLKDASCRNCERITSKFEGQLLRGPLLPLRIVLDLYTSDPAERPKTLPAILIFGDRRTELREIPVGVHPTPLALPVLLGPPYLTGESRGMEMIGQQWSRQFTDPAVVDAYLASENAWEIQLETTVDPRPLVRVVAKIAFCFAVAHVGLDGFSELFIPGVAGAATTIEDLSPYVGGLITLAPPEDDLHVVTVEINADGLIAVAVRLLARFGAPTYVAIVGRTDPSDSDRSWRHGVRIEPNHPVLGWELPLNARHVAQLTSRAAAESARRLVRD